MPSGVAAKPIWARAEGAAEVDSAVQVSMVGSKLYRSLRKDAARPVPVYPAPPRFCQPISVSADLMGLELNQGLAVEPRHPQCKATGDKWRP